MDASKSSRYTESDSRRHRSRSPSADSEGDRRRQRRRTERDTSDLGRNGSERHRERYDRSTDMRDKYDDRDRKRRRTRSPAHESSRRQHDDRDSKHRSKETPSTDTQKSRERQVRSANEDSNTQVTRKRNGPPPSELVPGDKQETEKQKPNFAPTGLLAAASNSISQADGMSIVLKYHEPPEARKPPSKDQWKLFVFKGAEIVETIELSARSCWLVGRELAVVDMPAEHPSISKQHAVIQFRFIEKRNEFGDKLGKVKPYLIDLESPNGTSLNKEELPASRYLELRDKDMIQFGHSTREYVLMLSPKD
jgi:smad nuclear-interacting protein 1